MHRAAAGPACAARSSTNIAAAASQKRHAIDTGGGTLPNCHLIAIQVVPQISTVTA